MIEKKISKPTNRRQMEEKISKDIIETRLVILRKDMALL